MYSRGLAAGTLRLTVKVKLNGTELSSTDYKVNLVKNGPYDFESTVPPHWDPKDYPLENAGAHKH